MKPRITGFTLLILTLALASCGEGRKNPPNVDVTLFHAAPGQGTIVVRRVEAAEALLEYQESAIDSWDADTYVFHFDVTLPDSTETRVASFTQELAAGNDYTFIAAEVGGVLQPLVLTAPDPAFTLGGPNSQVTPVHVAPSLGPVDVFLEPTGTGISTATPWASLAFTESAPPRTIAAGDYELFLTEAGNPTNILLESSTFAIPGTQVILFSIVDGAGVGSAPIAVIASGGDDVQIIDKDIPAEVRVINAFGERTTLDVGFDGELAPPALPGLAYADVSMFAALTEGNHDLTVTPAGNPSVLTLDEAFFATAGRQATWLIAGDQDESAFDFALENNRVIAGTANVKIYNGAAGFGLIDAFIVEPGTDLSTVASNLILPIASIMPNVRFVPGDYELVFRDQDSDTVIAGPTAITLEEGRNYSILTTDNAGGAILDVTLFDDFN